MGGAGLSWGLAEKSGMLFHECIEADRGYTCDAAQATITLSCLSLMGLILLSNFPFSCCVIHVPTVQCVHRCVMLNNQCMIILVYTCGKNAYPFSSPYR